MSDYIDVELLTQQQALEVQITPAMYQGPPGEPGKAPRIGTDGCWEIYDNETGDWITTGVQAGCTCLADGSTILDGGSAEGAVSGPTILDGGFSEGN